MNITGKYFRAKGKDGYGKSWVDKIEDARIYTKLPQAKGREPVIVELKVVESRIL